MTKKSRASSHNEIIYKFDYAIVIISDEDAPHQQLKKFMFHR